MGKFIALVLIFAGISGLITVGVLLVLSSYDRGYWANPPFDPSVFGAGVSVLALGTAFGLVIWDRLTRK